MSKKISKLKILRLNGDVIIARRDWDSGQVRKWYEGHDNEITSSQAVAFTDKLPDGKFDYATVVETAEFEMEDLPLFIWELVDDGTREE
jgi:hypothetical protein